MPEFLTRAVTDGADAAWPDIAVSLVVALLLGRVVALVYDWTRPTNQRTPSFPATLVLLSVLIAMVTQVIGDNLARAFGLVGALSIVRFRTVVRDTEDTAFVIFAVVVGMAVGAQNLPVALIGLVVVTVGAFWMRPKRLSGPAPSVEHALSVRVGLGHDLKTLVDPTLDAHTVDYRMASVSTAKQGLAINASYVIRLRSNGLADDLVRALNRLDGVQNVELAAPKPEDDAD